MSHICIAVVSGAGISSKVRFYEESITAIVHRHKKHAFFQNESDGNQPLFSHYREMGADYIYFSIADTEKYNNCEAMFVTCTENGECWEQFRQQMDVFQGIVAEISQIVSEKETLDIFIGDSGALYDDFEHIGLAPDEISTTLYQKTKHHGYWDFDIQLSISRRAIKKHLSAYLI